MSATADTTETPCFDPDELNHYWSSEARWKILGSDRLFNYPVNAFQDAHLQSAAVTDNDVDNCVRALAMTPGNSNGRMPMLRKTGRGDYQWVFCDAISSDWTEEEPQTVKLGKRKRPVPARVPDFFGPSRDPKPAYPVRAYAPLFDIMKSIYSFGVRPTGTLEASSPPNPYNLKQHPHEFHKNYRKNLAQGCIAEPEWDAELQEKMDGAMEKRKGWPRDYRTDDGRFYCAPVMRTVVPIVCCNTEEEWAFQIVGIAAQTILQQDLRRTWVLGVTIESENAFLWLFTRYYVIKTDPINWVEDSHEFVRMILTLSRSSPTQLGFDASVHRAPGTRDYIYEVEPDHDHDGKATTTTDLEKPPGKPQPLFYRPVETIVGPRIVCLTDRTTRVFKVIQVHSVENPTPVAEGKYAILKDVWIDNGVSSEAENQACMFAAVDAFVAQPDWRSDGRFKDFDAKTMERLEYLFTDKRYRNLFLTKLHAWKGVKSAPLPRKARYTPRLDGYDSDRLLSCAGPEGGPIKRPRIPKTLYIAKRQSRVIYEEICTPLSSLSTLGEAMDVIGQTTRALQVLFCAGWVHRDISSGNVMAYRVSEADPWAVKLTDFEFATEFKGADDHPKGWVHREPIGTREFLPVEVGKGKYLFQEQRIYELDPECEVIRILHMKFGSPEPEKTLAEQLHATGKAAEALSGFKEFERYKFLPHHELVILLQGPSLIPDDADFSKIPPSDSNLVVHNYQHDLESLWWLALYFVALKTNYEPGFKTSNEIFRKKGSVAREYMLRHGHAGYLDSARHDSWPFHPELKDPFFEFIKTTRKKMVLDTYLRPMMGQLSLPSSYSAVHALFATQFDELNRIGKEQEWANMKIHNIVPQVQTLFPF